MRQCKNVFRQISSDGIEQRLKDTSASVSLVGNLGFRLVGRGVGTNVNDWKGSAMVVGIQLIHIGYFVLKAEPQTRTEAFLKPHTKTRHGNLSQHY